MAYWKEVCICGAVAEVRKTIWWVRSRKGKRAKKTNATPACVKESNERIAERKLGRILNTNFFPGDYHLQLTYKGQAPSPEKSKEDLAKFLRALRKIYRDEGKEMKYVAVTEHEAKRPHHHLVINQIDPQKIQKAWTHGRVHFVALDDTRDYRELASYLIKETSRLIRKGAAGKRWSQSKNLKPYDKLVRRRVSAKEWRSDPKPMKGYLVEKSSVVDHMWAFGVHQFESQEYVMIRTDVWRSGSGQGIEYGENIWRT